MRKLLITTVALTVCASAAHAGDPVSEAMFTAGLPTVDSQEARLYKTCMTATEGTSREIRACSKSLKNAAPIYEVRSDIYLRRGLLYMSSGRFDQASQDFQSAAKLNHDNEFAYLGQGFAALMDEDINTARALFQECDGHATAGPLAYYGLGYVEANAGNMTKAKDNFEKAAEMRPGWSAPLEALNEMQSL